MYIRKDVPFSEKVASEILVNYAYQIKSEDWFEGFRVGRHSVAELKSFCGEVFANVRFTVKDQVFHISHQSHQYAVDLKFIENMLRSSLMLDLKNVPFRHRVNYYLESFNDDEIDDSIKDMIFRTYLCTSK